MKTKEDIIGIRSCFTGWGPIARAAHDLTQINKCIEKLEGDTSEFCIDFKDCGLLMETIEGVTKEVFVTDIIIKPVRFGGKKLQTLLDELAIQARLPIAAAVEGS